MKTTNVIALAMLLTLASGCVADVRYSEGGRELQISLKRGSLRVDARGEDAAIPPVTQGVADATH